MFLVVLCVPVFAHAQTASSSREVREYIAELISHIKTLESTVEQLKSQVAVVTEELRIERTLRLGMSGEDVKALQTLLSTDPSVYPEGRVTGYFGPLTEAAVKRFQQKTGIVTSGTTDTTGFGLVGPRTMQQLNVVLAKKPSGGSGGGSSAPAPAGGEASTPSTPTHTAVTAAPSSASSGSSSGGAASGSSAVSSASSDTTPPVISNIQKTSITHTGAVITWSTNEAATSRVSYGTTTVASGSYTTNHSVTLSGLQASTGYSFTVGSSDAAGNSASSSSQSLTTTAPPAPPVNSAYGPWITALSISPTSGPAGTQVTFSVTAEDPNGVASIVIEIRYPDNTVYDGPRTIEPNWNLRGVTSGSQTFTESVDHNTSPAILGEYEIVKITAYDSDGNYSRYYPNGNVENNKQSTHNLTIPSITIH